MLNYQFEFVTGCPGSSWSQITHNIRRHLDESYDMSDMRNHRQHTVPDLYYKKYTNYDPQTLSKRSRITHHGCYFGPSNEYGEQFDCISENYSHEEFVKECLRPFSPYSKPLRQIRSHWVAYNLDWLWENFKGHHLLLIWKDPTAACQCWYDVGGWDIKHPNYDWYRKLNNICDQIQKETDAILEFADRKNLQFINYNDDWFGTCYPEFNKPFKDHPLFEKHPEAQPMLIRTIIQ
jgi:hypothetical protein